MTDADLVDRQWRAVVAALHLLDDAQWHRPTRLAGWTVEDLARHVHWGVTLEVAGLALVGGDGSRRAAGRQAPADRAALVAGLDAARAELAERMRSADAAAAGAVLPMPYGDLPRGVATGVVFVLEAAVHRSDLAAALEPSSPAGAAAGDPALDADAVPGVAGFLAGFWPALAGRTTVTPPAGTAVELRGQRVRIGAAYDGERWAAAVGGAEALGAAATTTVAGPDSALLLWALGRHPLEPPLSVSGDRRHAERLKDYLPGP